MGLVVVVVGVLADDDDFDIVKRGVAGPVPVFRTDSTWREIQGFGSTYQL